MTIAAKPAFSTGFRLIGALGLLSLSACVGSKSDSSDTADGGSELSGEISVSGSSTVEPITVAVGEKFAETFGVTPTVDGPGTGDGFKRFCAGETDVSDASRPIKDEERQTCESAGIEFVELKIAQDALTVLTSESNTAVECLTLQDIYGLVGPESEGVAKWSQASEYGATSTLPDAELAVFAPGTESGTYDSMIELAIEKIADERGVEPGIRPDNGGIANDNEIINGIESNATSFGWVGFAFAENAEGARELEVDGGEGCVGPSADTVAAGEYPLSRALYLYVSKNKLEDNEALSEFVSFYLSDEGIAAVSEVGYVPLSAEDLAQTRQLWDEQVAA